MTANREARILIVEHQRVVASVLRTSLELQERGYIVSDVPSGEEAMLEILRTKFDLVVTDYRLPGLSGPELIRQFRPMAPETHVMLISDYPIEQIADSIRDLRLHDVLMKPVDIDAFVDLVNSALSTPLEAALPRTSTGKTGPLPPFQPDKVQTTLSNMLADLGAWATAFASRTGKIQAMQGSVENNFQLDELAVLLANNFTTTMEIGTYLGGKKVHAVHYYSGTRYDLYALPVDQHYFVIVVFPGGSQKQMGPVLRYGMQRVQQIAQHIQRQEVEEGIAPPTPRDSLPRVSPALEIEQAGGTYSEEEGADIKLEEIGIGEQIAIEDDDLASLDFSDFDIAPEQLEDLNNFWEEGAEEVDRMRADAISLDEAEEMGLFSDDEEGVS